MFRVTQPKWTTLKNASQADLNARGLEQMKEGHENKIRSKETWQSKCTLPIKTPCPDPKQIKENETPK